MFISKSHGGYYRGTEQHSGRGRYLALWSGDAKDPQTGKPRLYATVRSCALHQLGHWMMGTIRVAGQSVTVSGPCGSDGLPMDLSKLTPTAQAKLIEVPADVAAVYWADNGHNDIGQPAEDVLRQWARQTFTK